MRTSRRTLFVAVLAVFGLLLAPAAIAQEDSTSDDTDVTVQNGNLEITDITVTDFTDVVLDGTAQTTNATKDDFDVTDARGTGEGWNVTVHATQFAEHDGDVFVEGGATLATESLSMPELTVEAVGTGSPEPTITAGSYLIDTGNGAVQVASAAEGEGMGTYAFTQGGDLDLSIPADAEAATYRSTVTVDLNTGP